MNNDKKTVLFICTAGITTGLIVRNLQKNIDESGLPIHVYSAPAIVAEQVIKDQKVDALLIGPQAEYEVTRLKDILEYQQIPYSLILKEDYELLNIANILKECQRLVKLDS